jgi:hypothetical protein
VENKGKEFSYRRFKGRVIATFGTLRAAASAVGCHHNSVRLAGHGRCPRVRAQLEALL